MAHEIEIRADGGASFFHVGNRSAWHRLGTSVPEGIDLAEAVEAGHLGYRVERRPLYLHRVAVEALEAVIAMDLARDLGGSPEGRAARVAAAVRERLVVSQRCCVTVRTDTGAELGRVSPDYVPLQNTDAFAVLQPLLDEGLVRIECGGVLRGGEDAWLLAQLDRSRLQGRAREVFEEARIAPYALIRTNHSGRAGVLVAQTPIRVVCANTLSLVENGQAARALSVRHTGEAQARLVEAAKTVFADVIAGYEGVAEQMEALRRHALDEAAFRRLVLDVAVPMPDASPRFNPDARLARVVMERAERKRGRIAELWTAGQGHTGDRSAYEAYNGLVEALDHDEELFPARGGAWRLGALMDGRLAQMKKTVLSGLLRAAEANELFALAA